MGSVLRPASLAWMPLNKAPRKELVVSSRSPSPALGCSGPREATVPEN